MKLTRKRLRSIILESIDNAPDSDESNDDLLSDLEELQGKIIISAVKGIVPETLEIPAHYFQNNYNVAFEDLGIICCATVDQLIPEIRDRIGAC